jgi:hypothetical protein
MTAGITAAAIATCFLARAVYFHRRASFLANIEARWRAYIREPTTGYDNPNMRWLEERTNKVARLVGESGVRPGDLAVMRPAGLGYVQHVELGIFENWLVKNLEITPTVSTALIRAQGHYKDQRNRSLNPLSWVEDLIFLPRNLLSALNPKIPK